MPKPSTIATDLARDLLERNEGVSIADVRIGLGYTGVMLDDGRAGLAYTFRNEAGHGCSVFHRLRPLSGKSASELISMLPSDDPIEAAVGLACANALVNGEDAEFQDGDILDRLDLRPDDRIGMVGYFGPLVEALKGRGCDLTVFERALSPSAEIRPAEEAVTRLPDCQVALITATSIINHSIDSLLESAGRCRETVILGASTPFHLGIFRNRSVTMLSGVVVRDSEGILRVISEGGGMRYFGPHIRKVSLRVHG